MIIQQIKKENIVAEAIKAIKEAEQEIFATMDLAQEVKSPLPRSYFQLLESKLKQGVVIKRLGFGSKDDYNGINDRIGINHKKYYFGYIPDKKKYQRMIAIDRKTIFFGVGDLFFKSSYSPIVQAFTKYFRERLKEI